jgi:uncharacterized membrane protein YjfL (UPF0719 family)
MRAPGGQSPSRRARRSESVAPYAVWGVVVVVVVLAAAGVTFMLVDGFAARLDSLVDAWGFSLGAR